jgi:hypothetical protein
MNIFSNRFIEKQIKNRVISATPFQRLPLIMSGLASINTRIAAPVGLFANNPNLIINHNGTLQISRELQAQLRPRPLL